MNLRESLKRNKNRPTPGGGSSGGSNEPVKPKAPSAMSGKALGILFAEALKQNAIDNAIYKKLNSLFEKWGETKGTDKTENLRELRELYKTII